MPRTRQEEVLDVLSLAWRSFFVFKYFCFSLFPHQTSHKPLGSGSKVTEFLKSDAKIHTDVYSKCLEPTQRTCSVFLHFTPFILILFCRSFLRQEDGAAPVEVRRRHFPLPQPGTLRSVEPRPQRAAVITQ